MYVFDQDVFLFRICSDTTTQWNVFELSWGLICIVAIMIIVWVAVGHCFIAKHIGIDTLCVRCTYVVLTHSSQNFSSAHFRGVAHFKLDRSFVLKRAKSKSFTFIHLICMCYANCFWDHHVWRKHWFRNNGSSLHSHKNWILFRFMDICFITPFYKKCSRLHIQIQFLPRNPNDEKNQPRVHGCIHC